MSGIAMDSMGVLLKLTLNSIPFCLSPSMLTVPL